MTAPGATNPNELTDSDFDTLLNIDFDPDSSDQPTPPTPPAPAPAESEPPATDAALDAQRGAPTEPATSVAGPPATDQPPRRADGTFAPKTEATAKPAEAPAAGQQPATQPPAVAGFTPPLDSQPFSFRVDGEEVQPKGALAFADGYYFPKAVWDREIRPHYLGSRNAWRQRERDYQTRIFDAERATQTERNVADKIQQEVLTLLESGPDAIQAWLENYRQNAPLMRANIEKARYQEELEALKAAQQEQQEAAHAEALRPRLQQGLVYNVTEIIKELPELSVLGDTPDDVARVATDLWENYGPQCFIEHEQADPARGIAPGQITLNTEFVINRLQREAAKYHTIRDRALRANSAAKSNAAALTPAAPVQTPRATPPAKPSQASRKPAPRRLEPTTDDIVDESFKDFSFD